MRIQKKSDYQELKHMKNKDKKMKYDKPLYIDIKKTKSREA